MNSHMQNYIQSVVHTHTLIHKHKYTLKHTNEQRKKHMHLCTYTDGKTNGVTDGQTLSSRVAN